ncbi:MAG: hypothetical protein KH366_22170 [Clostridiaceae bacterium]|nr:hypothetical protein [Clostridiaceae bacterium]
MNSKERVIEAVMHREPDRVPVGEWGIDHDHVREIIGRETYFRNRKAATLAYWEGRRDEVVESIKSDYSELIEKLDYDLVTVELVPPKGYRVEDPPVLSGDGCWRDRRGRVYRYAASNDSIQCVQREEGKEEISEEDIEKLYDRADHLDESQFELIDYFGQKYGRERAVLCRSIDIYKCLMDPFLGDYTHQMMILASEEEEIMKLLDAASYYNRKIIERCAKSNVLIGMQGHDFGMNSGCMVSPDTLRRIFFPLMKRVNETMKDNGMIPFFHCCGRIWDILEDYIGAGYEGYQSIQESAGMDNRKVKELYGDRLTLWTGVQCETLVQGMPEDVEQEVRRNLDILMPGGGFLFGSTNSVQYGAKTGNYLKALETVRKYGKY